MTERIGNLLINICVIKDSFPGCLQEVSRLQSKVESNYFSSMKNRDL